VALYELAPVERLVRDEENPDRREELGPRPTPARAALDVLAEVRDREDVPVPVSSSGEEELPPIIGIVGISTCR
jgi:hypothetical protein